MELDARQSVVGDRDDQKDYFRVHVSASKLIALGLEKGDPCELNIQGRSVGSVIAWESNRVTKHHELHIPQRLLELYGVKPLVKVSLSKISNGIPGATKITLYEVDSYTSRGGLSRLRDDELPHWAYLAEHNLYKAETISPGMVFDNVEARSESRSFYVRAVNNSSKMSLYRFEENCLVEAINEYESKRLDRVDHPGKRMEVTSTGIGGLEIQLEELNREIASFEVTERELYGELIPKWTNGIVLHGPSGTGKTLLLRRIREAGWRGVFDLGAELSNNRAGGSKAIQGLKDLFANAREKQPSVILLDEVESFASDQSTYSPLKDETYIKALREEMQGLSSFRTVVLATTNSLATLGPKLMTLPGFSLQIEIPVPSSKSRASILRALDNAPLGVNNVILEDIANRTHDFVGAELAMLLYLAKEKAWRRIHATNNSETLTGPTGKITEQDFQFAFRKVKPTTIRGVTLEIPETRWNDIGGQEEVKEIFHHALVRRSKYPDLFKNLYVQPGKGLLLYGPPGCSKTMIARAAATESGYSFVAVKGAELLNMYVGETERKIREVFSLARNISPSIIFFDEIDALGTSRSDNHHSGLNIVTTLLNELDGINTLEDVFILAATNRPDSIDSALLRPGRFDKMMYIGPPVLGARVTILSNRTQKMKVDSDLDIQMLAEETDGFSGAELVQICNEAAVAAMKEIISQLEKGEVVDSQRVSQRHFAGAVLHARKAITSEMLDYFQDFRAKNSEQGRVDNIEIL